MDYEVIAWWSGDIIEPNRVSLSSESSLEEELEGGWFSPSPIQARLLENIHKQLQAYSNYYSE